MPAAVLAIVVLAAACGGSQTPVASRSRSVSASPTRSASRTEQSASSTGAPASSSAAPRTSPARSGRTESTAAAPAASAAQTSTSSPVRSTSTRTVTTSPSAAATSPASAAGGTGDSGTPAWVWWLIGLAAVALAVALGLVLHRRRRRQGWARNFSDACAEVHWVAETLIPSLGLEPSAAQMVQSWQPASARVMALEDRLTRLETTAPDADDSARARAVREALVTSRVRVNELVSSPDPAAARAGLASVGEALAAAVRDASGGRTNPHAAARP